MLAAVLIIGVVASSAAPIRVAAPVAVSIEKTLADKLPDVGAALAAQAARLLRWRGNLARNVQPGDLLSILYTEGSEPEILALAYGGAELQLRAYRINDAAGVPRFYDEKGRLIEPVLRKSPVRPYVQITEDVQHGRGARRHKGIDLKADEGTPVRLPWSAEVTRVNWARRVNGNCVEVTYTQGPARGQRARFLHLQHVAKGTQTGRALPAGTLIGAVGNTGRSSAPHLHYEIRTADDGVLKPLRIHGTDVGQLEAAQQPAFEKLRLECDRLLAGGA